MIEPIPRWTTELREQRSGLDHLGLGSVSNQAILATLAPDLFVLTRRPGYLSFYAFLLAEYWKREALPRRRGTWKDCFRTGSRGNSHRPAQSIQTSTPNCAGSTPGKSLGSPLRRTGYPSDRPARAAGAASLTTPLWGMQSHAPEHVATVSSLLEATSAGRVGTIALSW